MRILFVTNLYPPRVLGGYEMLCEEVAVQLASRGHEIQVLTSDFGGDEHDAQEAGIERALRLGSDIYYYRPNRYYTTGPTGRTTFRRFERPSRGSSLTSCSCGVCGIFPRLWLPSWSGWWEGE